MVPSSRTTVMLRGGSARVAAAALICLVACPAALSPSLALAKAPSQRATRAVDTQTLFRSRLLWSTIDVCSPTDQLNTVGIRGSMPSDHQAHDAMYMRFRLQYLDTTTSAWTDLAKGASSGYADVGTGAAPRQAGRSFQLSPVAGQSAFTLRGVVSFQWRHGSTVLAEITRATSAGRVSLAGTDPAGFSAATCLIG